MTSWMKWKKIGLRHNFAIGNINNTFATLFESDFQDSEYFTSFLSGDVS